MAENLPAIRSYLFVPGNRSSMVAKALASGADAIVIDLEDAVPADEKDAARGTVAEAASAAGASGSPMHVRVNTRAGQVDDDDLEAAVAAGAAAIRVPKCDSPETVRAAEARLAELERRHGRPAGSVLVYPTIESAAAVSRAEAIAGASERVASLVFGPADFMADIGVSDADPEACRWARGALVIASRTAGVAPPADGAFTRYRDRVGLLAEANHARSIGMFGKSAIHPDQVGVINSVFTPGPDQVDLARRIVELSEAAQVGAVDGQFVDPPIAERARRTLHLASRLADQGRTS